MELLRMIKKGTWISRTLPKSRHQTLDLKAIKDIPTETFLDLIKSLKSEDWENDRQWAQKENFVA
jgi:hypothetical protein